LVEANTQFMDTEEKENFINSLNKRCHSIYNIREVNSNKEEIFKDTITFHFLELPKFLGKENEMILNSDKYRGIKFLINPSEFKNDDDNNNNNELIKKAYRLLEALSKDEIFRESYEQRMREQRDYISGIYSMKIKLQQKDRIIEERNRELKKKKIILKIYF